MPKAAILPQMMLYSIRNKVTTALRRMRVGGAQISSWLSHADIRPKAAPPGAITGNMIQFLADAAQAIDEWLYGPDWLTDRSLYAIPRNADIAGTASGGHHPECSNDSMG